MHGERIRRVGSKSPLFGCPPFAGTLAAYTVYKLVVSAKARRKAILFLIGVIVFILLHALERWLFW